MTSEQTPAFEYFANTSWTDGSTAEHPAGVFRRRAGRRDEAFGAAGDWVPTDWFLERDYRGTESGTMVPITPEQAAVIIHRWRETGVVPKVEGVDIPPLPAASEAAPAPGAGPVSAAQAQAIGDEWVNGTAAPEHRIRAGIYEFDLGYLVYALAPAQSDLSAPPRSVGTGRGVIDRETGELTVWPALPFEVVAQMYRQSKAAGREQSPHRPSGDPEAEA